MLVQMKNKNSAIILIAFALVALIMPSCVDDWDMKDASYSVVWNPKLAFTIGSTTFKVSDLLQKFDSSANVSVDNDGLVNLVYEKALPNIYGEIPITIPAQNTINLNSPVVGGITLLKDSVIVLHDVTDNSIGVNFNSDQKITDIEVKTMSIKISTNSTFTVPAQMIVEFQNMKDHLANPYIDTINIPVGLSPAKNRPNKADHYWMNFSSSFGKSSMPMKITFKIFGKAGSTILGTNKITINMSIDTLKYRTMEGYVGKYNLLDINSSLNFPLLNQYIAKGVTFKNPQLVLHTQNSYGISVGVNVDKLALHYLTTVTPDSLKLIGNPQIINSAKITPPFMAAIDSLFYTMNATDTSKFSKNPDNMTYHVSLTSNPLGDTTIVNTLYDTSTVRSNLRIKLPIWFKSSGFGDTTSMAFSLPDTSVTNGIQSMLFRTVAENSLPVDMRLQVYFQDSLKNTLDSLYHDNSNLVASGNVGSSDIVITPTTNVKNILFDTQRIKSIEKTKRLFIKVQLKTGVFPASSGYVKFLVSNYLKISFACQLQYKKKF